MADLITLAEAKNGGVKGTDPAILQAITHASDAIRAYTDRDFGTTAVTATRRYEYDGSGMLDIDDASSVTKVEMIYDWATYEIPTTEWRAQPYGEGVYTYIFIPARWGIGSPAMGFNRNADVLAAEGRLGTLLTLADVTGSFGWPVVPGDVKQATVWTTAGIRENPGNFIASQAIEGYSRGYTPSPVTAIPERAKDMLAPYMRMRV